MKVYKRLPFLFALFCFAYFNIVVTQSDTKVKNEPEKTIKVTQAPADTKSMVVESGSSLLQQPTQETAMLTRHEVDLVNFFCKPIDFTPDGIAYYFKYVYNHPEYVHYLPYNLSHMIQFLEYGTVSGQNEQFAASVIKMFLQKVKAAPYVEAESFVEFIPKFTKAMKPYLEKKEASFIHEMQIVLKDKLSEIFAKYFTVFQKNPDSFMTSLAEQIARQTNQSITQQHIEVEQLKKDVVRFFEICANKLIWSSQDDIQSWYNCNRLAHECQLCLDQKVLCDQNAMDDMCWSFIHRFCYFVELSHQNLPKDFFAQVLHDLQTKPLVLTSLEEQEDLMTCKKNHLMHRMQVCRDMCCAAESVEPKLA